jgi:hypothetical protein
MHSRPDCAEGKSFTEGSYSAECLRVSIWNPNMLSCVRRCHVRLGTLESIADLSAGKPSRAVAKTLSEHSSDTGSNPKDSAELAASVAGLASWEPAFPAERAPSSSERASLSRVSAEAAEE